MAATITWTFVDANPSQRQLTVGVGYQGEILAVVHLHRWAGRNTVSLVCVSPTCLGKTLHITCRRCNVS